MKRFRRKNPADRCPFHIIDGHASLFHHSLGRCQSFNRPYVKTRPSFFSARYNTHHYEEATPADGLSTTSLGRAALHVHISQPTNTQRPCSRPTNTQHQCPQTHSISVHKHTASVSTNTQRLCPQTHDFRVAPDRVRDITANCQIRVGRGDRREVRTDQDGSGQVSGDRDRLEQLKLDQDKPIDREVRSASRAGDGLMQLSTGEVRSDLPAPLHQVSPLLQRRCRLGDDGRRRAGQPTEAGQGRADPGGGPLVRQGRVGPTGRLLGAQVAGTRTARVQQVRCGRVQRRRTEVGRPWRLGGVGGELTAGRLH